MSSRHAISTYKVFYRIPVSIEKSISTVSPAWIEIVFGAAGALFYGVGGLFDIFSGNAFGFIIVFVVVPIWLWITLSGLLLLRGTLAGKLMSGVSGLIVAGSVITVVRYAQTH